MSIELAHTRQGSGEPVVLLHGIGHRKEAYDPVVAQLAEKYEVFAVDMPGFGASPPLPAGTSYSTENVIAALADNFAQWGIVKPHVVGNSLGGAMALFLGQEGFARSVTALSPAGYFRPWSLLQAAVPLLSLKIGAYLPAPLLKLNFATPFGRLFAGWSLYRNPGKISEDRYYLDALAMKRSRAFWPMFFRCIPLGFTTPPAITGSAKVPTTIAWGSKDLMLNPSQTKLAAKKLAGVNFVTLTDCGHVPMSDSPEQVLAAIDTTIAKASTAATTHPLAETTLAEPTVA